MPTLWQVCVIKHSFTIITIVTHLYRLGLGAKVVRQSNVGPSNDPVDQKLYAKLNARKRKAAQLEEESRSSQKHGVEDDDEDVDEDSRSNSFMKRAAPRPLPSMMLGNKKRK